MRMRSLQSYRGFTLVEAVIVIVITGVIGAIVAIFIKAPVQAYFDTVRRAGLTDIADTTVRRMAREIQSALPNSVRVTGGDQFVEFLPIRAAGRYRAAALPAGGGDPLEFDISPPDNSFEVLGPAIKLESGDQIVIYNLGIPGADAYEGTTSSRRPAAAFGNSLGTVTFTPGAAAFPFASPGSRFQVVNTPVSYVCQPNSADPASGVLYRYAGYPIQPNQPAAVADLNALANVSKTILATNVSACAITYTTIAQQHLGLVSIYIALTRDGETVQLRYQVNVDNTP